MQDVIPDLSQYFTEGDIYKAIWTGVVILILFLVRIISIRIVKRNTEDERQRYKWRKNLGYITTILGIFIIWQIWVEGLESFATYLGLLSAGIAIALKDPLSSVAAWIYIFWRRPFDVGDRIQLGDHKGDVIDIRVFKFTILEIGNWVDADQSTGRVIHIANHEIFSKSLANYTSDFEFIWNELKVLVTFESDWQKAKKLLQTIADEHLDEFVTDAQKQIKKAAKSYLIQFRYLTPIVYTDVRDSGINLSIRYLTNPRKRRGTAQSLWEDILTRFAEHDDIDFAYPTVRYFDNIGEGKGYTSHPPHGASE